MSETMQQAIVDCATGRTTYVSLSPDQAATLLAQQAAAAAQAQAAAAASAAQTAFAAPQRAALAAVSASLHGPQGASDAAALAGLVHKVVADPPQPLSAPEQGILARFILRCLLP